MNKTQPLVDENLNPLYFLLFESIGSFALTTIYLFTIMNYKADKEIYGYTYAAAVAFLI